MTTTCPNCHGDAYAYVFRDGKILCNHCGNHKHRHYEVTKVDVEGNVYTQFFYQLVK